MGGLKDRISAYVGRGRPEHVGKTELAYRQERLDDAVTTYVTSIDSEMPVYRTVEEYLNKIRILPGSLYTHRIEEGTMTETCPISFT